MNVVADYFLRAKHWQLFLLLFGMFCFAGFALFAIAFSTGSTAAANVFSLVLAGLAEISYLFWLWSLGSFSCSILRPALRLNLGFFVFSLVYPPVYISAFMAFSQNPVPLLLFPLHLLAMFCLIYSLYFVSKSLVSAERGEPVPFSNYAGAFFLIWFFPIGVWIVQPRVNRLYADKKNAAERTL